MATVCGVIQRVNKLISVVPVKARSVAPFQICCMPAECVRVETVCCLPLCRYNPELGDVVVGRVTEVLHLLKNSMLLRAYFVLLRMFSCVHGRLQTKDGGLI